MSKSYMYVPGLAMPPLVAQQAASVQAFIDKIGRAFDGDRYMTEMVETIRRKGATAVDCRQSLHWVQIPKGDPPTRARSHAVTAPPRPGTGNMAKAFAKLGAPSANILSLKPGEAATPMKMTTGTTLTPCTAPEYMAQPMPSSSKTKALAAVGRGDTLYIIGHSNALGGSLTYKCPALGHIVHTATAPGCEGWQHSEKRHIDPVTLGSLLINEGLPAGTKFDIALVACFSAGLEDRELQTVQSFAQRLAGTLAGRGYQCSVYGATGLTSSSDSNEVRVATETTKLADGTIKLNPMSHTTLRDGGGQPFYRRFFRFCS